MNLGGRPPKKNKKNWTQCIPVCPICKENENGTTSLYYLLEDGLTIVKYKIIPSLRYYDQKCMFLIPTNQSEFFLIECNKACSQCRNGLRDIFKTCNNFYWISIF